MAVSGPLSAPIEAGRTLGGRYRLLEPIARGGMAEVWEAIDEVLSRPVAVKVLQAHLASDGIFLERFRREAVTAARLVHPGVVATFDTGVDDGTAFIVMELVRGPTLRQLMTERGRLEPWLAVAVARQIADALVHAHQSGLVHRDIKPANVLLTDDEWGGLRVKVTDFGIAKAGSGLGSDLTRTGTVLGTPKYLSPEQIRGGEPDARADLYSLGVVLYEMLAGEPPFVGNTDMATALAHLHDRAPRVSSKAPGIPPALDRLVGDLLAKEPARRVPSATVARQRLDALGLTPPLEDPTDGSRRRNGGRAGGGGRSREGIVIPLWSRVAGDRSSPAGGPGSDVTRRSSSRSISGERPAGSTPVMPDRSGPPPSLPGRPGVPGAAYGAYGAGTGALDRTAASGGVPGRRPPGAGTAGPVRPDPDRPRARPRPLRRLSVVVFALVATGAILAAVLLSLPGKNPTSGATGGAGPGLAIVTVKPFMLYGRPPDDPQGLPLTYDHNPTTAWHTDRYPNATFGNLYPGLGLAIQLSSSAPLHRLAVTSDTVGWSAQTFVASRAIHGSEGIAAWGQPTDSQSNINGSATFDLAGRRGQWVLLWITNLGPAFQAQVAELSVS